MADFNQAVLAKIVTLRNAEEIAQPTQKLDSTSVFTGDIPTERNADPDTPNDLNTTLQQKLLLLL